MAEIIIMPKLGFNMDEGQLVKWHRRVGETVKKGEVLFEINTDKTTMPVEATADGTVLQLMLEEGQHRCRVWKGRYCQKTLWIPCSSMPPLSILPR